ncbi:MAG: hypothetical protein CV081_08345 [Nitrospira sp. LK265]|nr:hypothetical protein [Nitrospira sp. LK265]
MSEHEEFLMRELALEMSFDYSTDVTQGRAMTVSIDKELLAILCCPDTKQAVSLAEESLLQKLNAAVARGGVTNLGKRPVSEELDGGLIRADQKILYPIRDNIPVMLIEEGIPLEQIR